jgi:hypothetical protein
MTFLSQAKTVKRLLILQGQGFRSIPYTLGANENAPMWLRTTLTAMEYY